jgi:sugar (pentulose or hexulose) kinase
MRAHLYTALGALKVGMDILMKQERVKLDKIFGHGGFFKTEGVGQRVMAAALDTAVSVLDTASEGGAWGIALLAAYMRDKEEEQSLYMYLKEQIFAGQQEICLEPEAEDVKGFEAFHEQYVKGLGIEKAAVELLG